MSKIQLVVSAPSIDPALAAVENARKAWDVYSEARQSFSTYEEAWFKRRDQVKVPVYRGQEIKSADDLDFAFFSLFERAQRKMAKAAESLDDDEKTLLAVFLQKDETPEAMEREQQRALDYARLSQELSDYQAAMADLEADPTKAALEARASQLAAFASQAEREAIATIPISKAGALALLSFIRENDADEDLFCAALDSLEAYLSR